MPNKKDITDLEERLAILDGKIKSHEGSSVNDEDLKALEQKLAEFELKIKDKTVNERDMAILKLRMRQFESKLQDRQGDSVGKENQKKTEGLVSSSETYTLALNKTTGPKTNDPPLKNVPAQDFKKVVVATDPVAHTKDVLAAKQTKNKSNVGSNNLNDATKTQSIKQKDSTNDTAVIKQDIPATKVAMNKADEISFDSHPHKVKQPTLTHDQVALLNTFSPKNAPNAPILSQEVANINKPVKTRVLLLSPKKWLQKYKNQEGNLRYISDEMSNIVLDGLEQSPYFENLEPTIIPDHQMKKQVVLEEDEDVVWLVDTKNFATRTYTNYSVEEEVLYAVNATINYQKNLKRKPSLKVVFIDYREKIAGRSSNCGLERNALIKLLGVGNVRQVVGRLAAGRHWDSAKGWIDPGTVWNKQGYMCSGTRTLYSPYAARTNYVAAI